MSTYISTVVGKGRAVKAARDLEPGEEIMLEKPSCFVVRTIYCKSHCFSCTLELDQMSSPCSKCDLVSFCDSCQDAKKDHGNFCYLATFIPEIANQYSVDIDLLLFLAKAISDPDTSVILRDATSEFENEQKIENFKSTKNWELINQQCTGIMQLESHRSSATAQWIRAVFNASESLIKLAKESNNCLIEADTVVRLALIVNSNAYGLGDIAGKNRDIGFGVFPFASLFNHSCRPNCMFTGDVNGKMSIRVLHSVHQNEELCFSYIDLYQGRESRQEELERTKHFSCNCERCIEPLPASFDRYIDGLLCQSDFCQKNIAAAGVVLPPGLLDDSGTSTNVMQAVLSGATVAVDLQSPSCQICCLTCSNQWIQEISKGAQETVDNIQILLNGNACSAFDVLELLTLFVDKFKKKLHQHHALMLKAHCWLVQCYRDIGDWRKATTSCVQVIRTMRQVLPTNHFELADYYFVLGDILNKKGESKKSIEAFRKCHKIRSICCGPNHPRTLILLEHLK